MKPSGRFQGTSRYIQAHWPTFLFGYGGGFLAGLAIIWLSLARGWLAFVTLTLAVLMVLAYFLFTALWVAHQLYDDGRILDIIWSLGRLRPTDHVVHVNLGGRYFATRLGQRLTTGQVVVIDVYNPQLTPNRALTRRRRQASHPAPDPRLSWIDGSIYLLPLPDGSVPTVILVETLSEFWQHGDRVRLLREAHRILLPGGRLLLAERVRTPTYWLTMGPTAVRLQPDTYWRDLLVETGFRPERQENMQDLMRFWRATKPLPGQSRQLVFDF
jgi:ubiquinone/menaquinone biosynthesis C-methylase UbiE